MCLCESECVCLCLCLCVCSSLSLHLIRQWHEKRAELQGGRRPKGSAIPLCPCQATSVIQTNAASQTTDLNGLIPQQPAVVHTHMHTSTQADTVCAESTQYSRLATEGQCLPRTVQGLIEEALEPFSKSFKRQTRERVRVSMQRV